MYYVPMFSIYYVSPPLCAPPFLLRRPEAEDDALEKNPFLMVSDTRQRRGGGGVRKTLPYYGEGEGHFVDYRISRINMHKFSPQNFLFTKILDNLKSTKS
jgi:hypothetical protein